MNIPDPAVYSSLPIIGGAFVWSIRALIREQQQKSVQLGTDNQNAATVAATATKNAAAVAAVADGGDVHLTARDWFNIMAAIEKQFNGRYWLASEARAAMAELRKHSEEQTDKLHERISKLREELT